MDTKLKIEQQYRYYTCTGRKVAVKMYFLNKIPFTFDQLTELEVNDPLIIEECEKYSEITEAFLYQSSDYLVAEECHPCIFEVELENPQDLPVDK
tara:strand:+ start:1751 stop:2035 length:285 start_codon:yes stop_codon:yes gene_type:complete